MRSFFATALFAAFVIGSGCGDDGDGSQGSGGSGVGAGATCTPFTEVCNGADDDCDGEVDEDGSALCPPRANVTQTACEAGRCTYECEASFFDCNADGGDGCETQTASDPEHCGACGLVCNGTCSDGNCTFVRTVGGNIFPKAIAATSDGGMLATGHFELSADFGGGARTSQGTGAAFVVRFDAGGNHVWDRVFTGNGGASNEDIALDANGNIYLVGQFANDIDFGGGTRSSPGANHIHVVSLTSSGDYRWDQTYGTTNESSEGYGIAADPSGNVAVTGMYLATIDFGGGVRSGGSGQNMFVLGLDEGGGYRWDRTFSTILSAFVRGRDVALDASGNVFIAGAQSQVVDFGGGSVGGNFLRGFVLALQPDGNYAWDAPAGGRNPQRLALDGANLRATGYTNNMGSDEIVVFGLDPQGQLQWNERFNSALTDRGFGVAVAADGTTIATGQFQSTLDFGGGMRTAAGQSDAFVLGLNADGSYAWDRTWGGSSDDLGAGVAVSSSGNILALGSFAGTVDFGGGPIAALGAHDLYLVSFRP